MLEVNMSEALEARLHELAHEAGQSAHDFALTAIKRYMEDYEDTLEAMAAREEGGPTYSMEEVMRELGLDNRVQEKSPETAA